MEKNIEYQIVAHENGWGVVVADVMRAVYPSRHLALAAAKLLESDVAPTQEPERFTATTNLTLTDAATPSLLRSSLQVEVAVPYQVDIPLRRRGGEVSFPSSIGGLNLAGGKV
ncbi:hypothetical protein G6L26_025890 (plasmid) [Agrobacterium radiobacter]|uniref:Uncharacterized protein n=1 Tax=Agrobacterium tumefaciens str. B6 TaxID=1183423 RepID=A0A822V844_AGRTU|nr:hypothetical protein [Agrobacterium tumefaciens]KWT81357.1 hypothetical protein ASB65_16655 [Agrobacterium tumefaciens str. B6]MQB27587.1 hypothetical protein [Agrobacterium tumefaciens]NTA05913.1 hypothetical protein [Agrobacterium tumefaciens]NTA94910.1 hypothetical protein [Agrobacterium tumefaciens]NTB13559.1 hypothetical protein [Agrobacterium tumefaciens]